MAPRADYFWQHIFADARAEAMVADVRALAARWAPHVIVRDQVELGGCLAAESLGLPHAVVQTTALRPRLDALIAAPLQRLRAGLGLPADPQLAMLYRYLILTVGREQDPAQFGPQSPNVHIARYIPQTQLFPRCHAVLCHGGTGTTLAALAHGLPLVIVPLAADQPENAARCAAAGVGRVIRPEALTPARARRCGLCCGIRRTARTRRAWARRSRPCRALSTACICWSDWP